MLFQRENILRQDRNRAWYKKSQREAIDRRGETQPKQCWWEGQSMRGEEGKGGGGGLSHAAQELCNFLAAFQIWASEAWRAEQTYWDKDGRCVAQNLALYRMVGRDLSTGISLQCCTSTFFSFSTFLFFVSSLPPLRCFGGLYLHSVDEHIKAAATVHCGHAV